MTQVHERLPDGWGHDFARYEREGRLKVVALDPEGGTSITEGHISTLTDSIVLLRYVEMFGAVQRGITVLKMHGSSHDHEIREYRIISGSGMHIGEPFRTVGGILTGAVVNHASLPSQVDDVMPPPV